MDRTISPGTSIQTTIAASANGDRILLTPGAYVLDNTLTINKSVTIKAAVDNTYPNIRLSGTTYVYILNFAASNILLDGLDIDNTRGGGQGSGYFHNTVALSNLAFNNCKFHHFRRMFLGDTAAVNGFTALYSQFYKAQYTTIEIDNGKNIVIKYNVFYDQMNAKGEGAVTWYIGTDLGTSEISYNYMYGHRIGVEVSTSVVNGASVGTLDVAHNTIDMYTSVGHAPNILTPYVIRYGISLWANPGKMFNGANVRFRDNIISRGLTYAVYGSPTKFLTQPLIFNNNLFYDNYWYYWPATGRYTNEWFGDSPIAAIGWGDATDSLLPINCMSIQDPMFAMTGTQASEFYSLLPGSPALYSASDGLNIGAWQGGLRPEKQFVPPIVGGLYKKLNLPWIKPIYPPVLK
jgi:hypothetical protein